MKINHVSCVFTILTLILTTTCNLYSQEIADSTFDKDVTMEEIVVTAARIEVPFSRALRSIEISTTGDIRLCIPGETGGVMEILPGVDIRQRGAPGQQADISIRGGTFDQTMILVNGVNVSDPQTGHHNMDLPFDVSSIERIELLRGPGARIFGPNAFNGVVNVIVRDPRENKFSAYLTAGSHNFTNTGLSLSLKGRKTADMFTAVHSESDGYIANTDFKNTALFNSLIFSAGKTKFELLSGYVSKAFGANSFYSPKYPDQFETTQTLFGSLKASFTENISPVIYWRRHYDCFELFRDDAPSWYAGHNYHMTDALGSDFNYSFTVGERLTTSVGYSLRHEKILSTKLGEKIDAEKEIPDTDGMLYGFGDSRFNAGLMAEQSFSGKRLNLSGGVLINYSDGPEKGVTIYPGLDAGYFLTGKLNAYASVNRTLRQPTFTDLYYNDPVSKGNPDLLPEEAWEAEAGLKYKSGPFKSECAFFQRYGKNMIDWVRQDDSDKWQVMNLTSVKISGIELSSEFGFREAGSSFLNYIRVGYTWLHADKSSSGYQSKYLLDILRNKIDVVFAHKIYNNISANWSLSWQDRAGGFIRYNNGVAESSETPFSDLLLLDGRINYRCKGLQLFIAATNIANTEYFDLGNVRQPGRWIKAGIVIEGGF